MPRTVARGGYEVQSAGVHQRELDPVPVRIGIQTVARRAGLSIHDGEALPDNAVEQGGLADIGTADDGDERFGHKGTDRIWGTAAQDCHPLSLRDDDFNRVRDDAFDLEGFGLDDRGRHFVFARRTAGQVNDDLHIFNL